MATNPDLRLLNEKKDVDWIRQSLFLNYRKPGGPSARTILGLRGQQVSISTLSFADTSLGGNRSINPRPQFTKLADPNLDSLLVGNVVNGKATNATSMGMGRYYAENIDSNAQRIYMQFGIPAFNSLTNFFSTFYDPGQGKMANSGRVSNDVLFTAGKFLGYMTLWNISPILGVGNLLYGYAKKAYHDITKEPLSKYYYMKSTMPLYWSTVTVIVNALTVNMHLAQGIDENTKRESKKNPTSQGITRADVDTLNKLLPDIFRNGNGGIDVRAVANRYQRLADAHENAFSDILENSNTEEEARTKIIAYLKKQNTNYGVVEPDNLNKHLTDYTNSVSGTGEHLIDKLGEDSGKLAATDNTAPEKDNIVEQAISSSIDAVSGLWTGLSEHLTKYKDFTIAEARDGSAFVSFIVDYQATVSESFSNNSKPSDIATSMNATASSFRNKTYNLAGGNIGEGIGANTVEAIVGGIGDVLSGIVSSFGVPGLAAMGGKAFIDMPEFWDSSTTSLPANNYNIQLRSPYGNSVSILTNIMVPLAMLLAGVTPRTTGRNSYTGPFLCKLWHKGRVQVQLGMITSMTITRGTGSVGWNIKDQPTGIDVSFSVANLSKMLHMPISTDLSVDEIIGLNMFDEDTNFTDYMAVLASLGLAEQYYDKPRWALKRARGAQNFENWLSVSNFANWTIDTTVGSFISGVAKQAAL